MTGSLFLMKIMCGFSVSCVGNPGVARRGAHLYMELCKRVLSAYEKLYMPLIFIKINNSHTNCNNKALY